MTFSFTPFAYFLNFLAVSLLSYRFYQNWQRDGSKIAKLFCLSFILFGSFFLITAIGSLFPDSAAVLRGVVVIAAFLQGLAGAVISFIVIYTKFPKISPWLGFILILLLGLGAVALTILVPFDPFLDKSGAINWDIQSPADILRGIVWSVPLLFMGIILFQQAAAAKETGVKIRALGLGSVFLIGLVGGFFDFFLEKHLDNAIYSDIAVIITGILMLALTILTQKSLSSENNY